jgi:hypothetical protein
LKTLMKSAAVVCCVLLVCGACRQKQESPQASGPQFTPTTATGPAEATYTIRGRVSALPNPPKTALVIHHEEIPDFADAEGNIIGMEEMEMQFPFLAAGVSLEGVAVGDPVEAVMEMRYKGQPRFLITRITKLPADTPLNLGTIETAP